ncbi:hypothetical protein CPLU01_08857 [Colletotrichum plurivorum]|uniref:Nephrocystin 3-like N-terminal domain-containing protein n=1 Tax=Colletotrichum plurivorum TaxID=2175906 RepID=A0A8H6NCI8_9PEZI|nr:hypothetical protein CPLU01_08857 [Colletotrichum plurivorum]
MDPLSAVGFASSILTFVEFSFKVISGTLEIVRSGNTAENAHVSVVINDLHRIAKNLRQLSAAPNGSTYHDDGLDSLTSECLAISNELVALLQKLKIKAGDSKWKSINVSLRSMWARGDVAYLENRLDKCRSQIMMRLLLLLNDRQTSIMAQLQDAHPRPEMGAPSLIERLTALQDNLVNPVETPVSDELLRMTGEARISINNLLSASARLTPEMVILKKLYFDSIYSREDNIENADSNTFRWMIEEEPGDCEGETQDSLEKTRRKEAREQFQGWLSGRSGIFHISGKAGSGKSTLMKLLFTDAQSRVELRRWAGERKLIFARFFAFKAGDRLQRSFEGLQRSILFETLKQFPELIRPVFPDAFAGLSRANKVVDMEYEHFRPQHWTLAMERLIAESTKLDHCICFFIDGFDEFGNTDTDRLHQERLAEQLNLWASTGENVKILISSRPYRAFHDAFPNHQRIKLNQLTRDDIAQFSRNMFEKDKNSSKVKDCYEKLVDRVVADADGVFLWARLVMRSLILATRRSTKLAYLEKHLDQTPKDLNDLYDRLLSSIGIIDRPMAFKMLLLVAEMETLSIKLPPVALSWIDDLDDPGFPAVAELAPYTYKEVKTVQFFHRTVLDFVRESRLLQSFAGENPGFFTLETPSRLILAQLWFLDSSDLIPLQTIEKYLVVRTSEKDRQANLGKLRRVVDRYQSGGSGTFSARSTFPHWTTMPAGHPQLKMSFLHWVARRSNTSDYVRDEMLKSPELLRSEDGLSLVVSASFNPRTTATLWDLFKLGASPDEEVRLGGSESKHQTTATAWVILCVVYICHAIVSDGSDYSEVLGQFLVTKSVDPDCVALISVGRTQAEAERTEPTHCISLRQLIRQAGPPNLERLESLIDDAESAGSTTAEAPSIHNDSQEKNDLTALLAEYPPFDVSMQDESRTWVVRDKDQDLTYTERFYVHSVVWKTMRYRPTYMKIRLC